MTDSTGRWLQAAGNAAPLLTASQELTLGRSVREWLDWPGGPEGAPAAVKQRGLKARDRMVQSNLRLVMAVAKRYWRTVHQRGLAALAVSHLARLDELGLDQFEALLTAPDQEVYAWLRGAVDVPAEYDNPVFAGLKAVCEQKNPRWGA